MLTIVYTTSPYTVVYNLFFVVACVSFCLPVVMCRVLDMCVAWMDMLPSVMGVRGQIQAASLSSVQQKGS